LRIIDRYILREMLVPFFASLGIMTFVLLLGKILQLMDLMVNKGINLFDIAKLILLLMPYFLLFTIPISLLLAILIGLGRLASDNEITVLKSAGVSIYRLLYPLAGASFLAFLVTLSLGLYFVPYGNYATKDLLFSIVRQNASASIKERVFNDNFKGLLLYANHIPAHGDFMEGVIVSDSRIGEEPSTIFADKAYLISDPESKLVSLRLENGSTHTLYTRRKSYRKMDFSFYDINLDLESSLAEKSKKAVKDSTEMTPGELITKIKELGGDEVAKRDFLVELNKKFAMPLTCIIFGILGLSIGVTVRKATRARGLTIGIIIVLLYYILQLGGTALTETGKIAAWVGLWFPNLLFACFSVYLLIRVAGEKKQLIDLTANWSRIRQWLRRSV